MKAQRIKTKGEWSLSCQCASIETKKKTCGCMIFLFSVRHQTDSQTPSDKGKRDKKCSLLSTTHLSKQQEDDSDLLAAQKKGGVVTPAAFWPPPPPPSSLTPCLCVSPWLPDAKSGRSTRFIADNFVSTYSGFRFFNIIFWELAQEVPKSRP